MISKVKGTYDLLPNEISKWQYLEKHIKRTFNLFGYEEIRTPILEHYELIHRKNDSSDMVNKETYDFLDHGGRMLTLRPENTAGIVRAYIENKLYAKNTSSRLFYIGPNFRYERPQKGRFRQFSQFGVEVFGANSILADLEMLSLIDTLMKNLNIDATLNINSIGDKESRSVFTKKLKEYFSNYENDLCEDCKKRLETNPLRILDCKVCNHKHFFIDSPKPLDFLNITSKATFNSIIELLDKSGIKYAINKNLVRGLDYYNDLVFEVMANVDETELAIGGGGRYDSLVSDLGGPETKAIGFAFGMERVVSCLKNEPDYNLDCVTLFLEDKYYDLKLLNFIRENGYSVKTNIGGNNFKNALTKAYNENPKYILVVGENEVKNNQISIKVVGTKENIIVSNYSELLTLLKR